ncbi:MAG: hypothetical protein AYK19_13550 [Theionarchaea archaeon DG-70-1]|nr:MAG: hypothetical protein AYK19_13550 [Theionarchaea archaeon DG-70-1]
MHNTVDEKVEEEIRKRVQKEFPGCKALQDLHYYRYIKEIEWQKMTPTEIIEDIRKGADEIKKEMKTVSK